MFTSKRATLGRVLLEGENVILGPSRVGDGSILGKSTVIGYPSRSTLKRELFTGTLILEWSATRAFDPSTYDRISSGAKLGDGSTVRSGTVIYEKVSAEQNFETGHHVLIREDTNIGRDSKVGSSTIIDGRVTIGDRVEIQSGAYLPPMTIVEDSVFIAPRVTVTNDRYPPSKKLVGVTLKRGAVIGANAILIAGVTVGDEAIVAAGALVTRDVSPRTVVMGAPARPKMSVEEYQKKKEEYEKT